MSIVLRCGKRGSDGDWKGDYHTVGIVRAAVELAQGKNRRRAESIGYRWNCRSRKTVNDGLVELLDDSVAAVGRSPRDCSANFSSYMCDSTVRIAYLLGCCRNAD